MTIPDKIYLTRKDVLALVGGRRQLEKLERARRLRRVKLPGYTWAHYRHGEVKRVVDELNPAST